MFAPLDLLRPREGRSAHELRALGFPFGHDKDGTHVTPRTSADRLLGQEWLEVDVEQAHPQRLGEGFSGAAVYDPRTGLVVGIVTDAVLDGDQEGYIGRMLPPDTIRGHWEGLDALLPRLKSSLGSEHPGSGPWQRGRPARADPGGPA
ncbi:hypothetical protein ACWDVB_36360, partial [Streptomyces sp. NPDC003379]